MVNLYTVDSVDQMVDGGTDELDEHIDFFKAVVELPTEQMIYLSEKFAGYSTAEALDRAGVAGNVNATRFHADAIRALTRVLNGVSHGV